MCFVRFTLLVCCCSTIYLSFQSFDCCIFVALVFVVVANFLSFFLLIICLFLHVWKAWAQHRCFLCECFWVDFCVCVLNCCSFFPLSTYRQPYIWRSPNISQITFVGQINSEQWRFQNRFWCAHISRQLQFFSPSLSPRQNPLYWFASVQFFVFHCI